jgi:hypothetical protein
MQLLHPSTTGATALSSLLPPSPLLSCLRSGRGGLPMAGGGLLRRPAVPCLACCNSCGAPVAGLLRRLTVPLLACCDCRSPAATRFEANFFKHVPTFLGSSVKNRNRTERTETEIRRFLCLKRTNWFLFSENRISERTKEPNGSVRTECPGLVGREVQRAHGGVASGWHVWCSDDLGDGWAEVLLSE